MKTNLTQKLGALALCSLLALSTLTTGCTSKSVAQDIVNWTPTVVSTAQVVATTVAALDPASAAVIAGAVAGFDLAANTLSTQAQAYLANPNQTTLQAIQTQITTFQQQVNTALLQAAKIINPASQQKVLTDIQALAVGVNAILALVASIQGNTVQASAQAVKIAQVENLMDHKLTVAMVAAHYGESEQVAAVRVEAAESRLALAGF